MHEDVINLEYPSEEKNTQIVYCTDFKRKLRNNIRNKGWKVHFLQINHFYWKHLIPVWIAVSVSAMESTGDFDVFWHSFAVHLLEFMVESILDQIHKITIKLHKVVTKIIIINVHSDTEPICVL